MAENEARKPDKKSFNNGKQDNLAAKKALALRLISKLEANINLGLNILDKQNEKAKREQTTRSEE